ncbi:G-patch domain and KOW motifs-containing protein-like isoform X2 [Homarus americanus]|uniref:G-patch domain and KOW motifs-containing protein-like isoform X2 n=1 Tax=Homarus americanus TaxID=6706 RepID=UPI001C47C7FF|nr:G-patch domain and KOW motifs-containing protein-like isoform X2 [Homarus americanus]
MSAQKFTLSFSRKIEKKSLQPSVIRSDALPEVKDTTEILQSIEENVLKTDGPTETELVIPMLAVDRAAIFQKLAEKLKESKEKEKEKDGEAMKKTELDEDMNKEEIKPLTLDEQAAAAVLEDSKRLLDGWSERGTKENITISLASKENDIDTQVVDLGKESSLDDYDQVDVAVFGAAVLRGMGWKKSEGIGRGNKKVVEIITPSSKTFGLAGKNMEGQAGSTEGNGGAQEEEQTITKGSHVFIHSGRQRGTYGVVESLDEDHLIVKAAVTQNMIREVELNVRVVSQKEFKDSSRVINKDMYDKFKEEEGRKKEMQRKPMKGSDQDSVGEERKKTLKKEVKSEDTVLNVKDDKKIKKAEHKKELRDVEKMAGHSTKDAYSRHKNEDTYSKSRNEYSSRGQEIKGSKKQHEHTEASREVISDTCGEKYKPKYSEKYGDNEKFEHKKNDRPKGELSKHKYSGQSQSSYSSYKSSVKRGCDEEDNRQGFKKVQKPQDKMPAIPWVRENLRVRLISKSYKGGKYHKEKKGRILQLHKEQEKASVQLFEDETVIMKLRYDDICEYSKLALLKWKVLMLRNCPSPTVKTSLQLIYNNLLLLGKLKMPKMMKSRMQNHESFPPLFRLIS